MYSAENMARLCSGGRVSCHGGKGIIQLGFVLGSPFDQLSDLVLVGSCCH